MKTQTSHEPDILTANTYFWNPAGSAVSRRSNEERGLQEVREWFEFLGMKIIRHTISIVVAEKGDVWAWFNYEESCRNVYKKLMVEKAGKRSNITRLRKMEEQL